MKRRAIACTLLLLLGALTLWGAARPRYRNIEFEGRERSYLLHLPPAASLGKPLPLVFVLHGGGGRVGRISRLGFSDLADREGFIVVYPQGLKNWNDGRGDMMMPSHAEDVDDVGFLKAVLEEVAAIHPVDRARVYATGASNGGMMSHRLAADAAATFAAIAPVIGGLAEPLEENFSPSHPVAVLVIQGVADPIVPYGGGNVQMGRQRPRGRIVSTDKAVEMWVRHNGCKLESERYLEDTDPNDGCSTKVTRYSGGRDGATVELYRVEGMGHTWPGGKQYLPRSLIGPTTRDFDANEVIWKFLAQHSRR